MNEKDTFKSGVKVFIGVGIFLGLMYLCVVGMEKLGVFMAGYTAPTKETKIDYEYINVGTVFNRPDKVYYVLFDGQHDHGDIVELRHLRGEFVDVVEDAIQRLFARAVSRAVQHLLQAVFLHG